MAVTLKPSFTQSSISNLDFSPTVISSHKFTCHKLLKTHVLTPSLKLGSRRPCSISCLKNNSNAPEEESDNGLKWQILKRWDVPWNWQTSLAYAISLFFSGKIDVASLLYSGLNFQELSIDQYLKVLLIGYSSTSTACLVGTAGILCPILEETFYRGFLMVALTKWLPTPLSVLASAAVFALKHRDLERFPNLFVAGTVLGFSYAQTRNLLTPIATHSFWNCGIILVLTMLKLQGYDIEDHDSNH